MKKYWWVILLILILAGFIIWIFMPDKKDEKKETSGGSPSVKNDPNSQTAKAEIKRDFNDINVQAYEKDLMQVSKTITASKLNSNIKMSPDSVVQNVVKNMVINTPVDAFVKETLQDDLLKSGVSNVTVTGGLDRRLGA